MALPTLATTGHDAPNSGAIDWNAKVAEWQGLGASVDTVSNVGDLNTSIGHADSYRVIRIANGTYVGTVNLTTANRLIVPTNPGSFDNRNVNWQGGTWNWSADNCIVGGIRFTSMSGSYININGTGFTSGRLTDCDFDNSIGLGFNAPVVNVSAKASGGQLDHLWFHWDAPFPNDAPVAIRIFYNPATETPTSCASNWDIEYVTIQGISWNPSNTTPAIQIGTDLAERLFETYVTIKRCRIIDVAKYGTEFKTSYNTQEENYLERVTDYGGLVHRAGRYNTTKNNYLKDSRGIYASDHYGVIINNVLDNCGRYDPPWNEPAIQLAAGYVGASGGQNEQVRWMLLANNTILNCPHDGIFLNRNSSSAPAKVDNTLIYNNIITGSQNGGYLAKDESTSTNTEWSDNCVYATGAKNSRLNAPDTDAHDADPGLTNYRPTSASSLVVNIGRTIVMNGVNITTELDANGVARVVPIDLGAIEYIPDDPDPGVGVWRGTNRGISRGINRGISNV